MKTEGKTLSTDSLKEEIWQWVAAIPAGRVATYGQIARLAGYPGQARFVGTTMKRLPRDTTLPWHRILKSDGRLAFPVASTAWNRQKALLEHEGVIFSGLKLSLTRYQWQI